MKSLKTLSLEMRLLLLFLMAGGAECHGAADSVRISLLTCSPHEQIYSLYGHTAIRYQDTTTGDDFVVNYGIFNFDKPHFILRFVFGLTDYEMGIAPYRDFVRSYAYYNSGITEQEVNLTEADKNAILRALEENARPENIVYRYNYFYDNCSTRARDMLTKHLSGTVQYPPVADSTLTFRKMVHECTAGHPWMQFGIDLLLGVGADRPTTGADQQFLPKNVMRDFSRAVIKEADGSERPLVSNTVELLKPGAQIVEREFPISPTAAFGLFFLLTIAITVIEIFRRKLLWLYDILLMLLTGLAGIIIFAMIFSQHPTVSLNLLILLLNPLPLFFIYPVARSIRKGKIHYWWTVWGVLTVLSIAGGFFQSYPIEIYILALSLLVRIVTRKWILGRSKAS